MPDSEPNIGTTATAPLHPLAALLDDWQADARARHAARTEGRPLGPITGFAKVDCALGLSLAPGLHIVHGVPGVGKTAFSLQVAAACGCPALYVTVEMPPLELLRRIAARVTKTPLSRFKTGELPPDESQKKAATAVNAACMVAILDGTRVPAPAARILAAAEATRNLRPATDHLLIVVDSLNSWTESVNQGLTEYESLNTGLQSLHEIASRLACPILVVAERNRLSMDKGGLSAAAGTRRIEYGAETVFDLGSDKVESVDANGELSVDLHVRKNRNGMPSKDPIRLRFHGGFQRYTEEEF